MWGLHQFTYFPNKWCNYLCGSFNFEAAAQRVQFTQRTTKMGWCQSLLFSTVSPHMYPSLCRNKCLSSICPKLWNKDLAVLFPYLLKTGCLLLCLNPNSGMGWFDLILFPPLPTGVRVYAHAFSPQASVDVYVCLSVPCLFIKKDLKNGSRSIN